MRKMVSSSNSPAWLVLCVLAVAMAVIVTLSLAVATGATNGGTEATTIVLTVGNPIYFVDGEPWQADTAPFISNGRTMVPLRLISEALGADVEWDETTQTVTISQTTTNSPSRTVEFSLSVGMPLPNDMGTPVIQNGRTFVPLRYVAEAFGAEVDWDSATQIVTIVDKSNQTESSSTVAATNISSVDADEFEQSIFEAINADRLKQGISTLEWCDVLTKASRWMAGNVSLYEAHIPQTGTSISSDIIIPVSSYTSADDIVETVNQRLGRFLRNAEYEDDDLADNWVTAMGVGYNANEEAAYVVLTFVVSAFYDVSPRTEGFDVVYHGGPPWWIEDSPYEDEYFNKYNPYDIPWLLRRGYTEAEINDIWAREILAVLNTVRELNGLNPLIWDDSLGIAARKHTQDFGRDRHTSSDGSSATDRARHEGWQGSGVGEILGGVHVSPGSVIASITASPNHWRIVVDPYYTHVGAGIGHDEGKFREWAEEMSDRWLQENDPRTRSTDRTATIAIKFGAK
ncbi:stalk domain-containing protein [Candidatus Saccharibacteria bacterium]|nr:stalk domain-containing protein [Candidatus Saccharibacteria bacterium]